MKVKYFLQLIRYKNLLMLFLVQFLFANAGNFHSFSSFHFFNFILLAQATIFIAAAGNVINDYFDIVTDKINKPNKVLVGNRISKKAALFLYSTLNILGIVSGIVLAYINHKPVYSVLFLLITLLLYYYSKTLKKIALVGNVIVSIFISLSIILVLLFPSINNNLPKYNHIITVYAIFAFILNFIRELLKDVEDINGDYNQKMKTLPIIIGKKRTLNILFYLNFIPFILSILIASILKNNLIITYILLFITLPLAYFIYKIKETKNKKQLSILSALLKLIMILGMLSILFINQFVLKI